MATDSGDDARPLPPGRAALLHCISIAILAWGSIWIFLFQHATELQRDLLFHPVLAVSALVAVAVAGHRPRFGPWAFWLGAMLAYTVLGSALNTSFFASWERVHSLLVSVAFGIPILLALRQAEIGPRILCGACIVLSLAGLLDNVGVDLRAGIADLVNTDLVSEGIRIEIVTDRSDVSYWRSQRSHEVWILCLAWIALAALRPATRREWLVATVVLAVAGLAVATGYSSATKLISIAGVGAFCAAFPAPRIALGLALATVFVLFLGAPVWAEALWSWYVHSPETFDVGTAKLIARVANWEYWAELIERRPWTGLGVGAYWKLPFMPLAEVFGARPSAVLHPGMEYTTLPHNLPLQVWGDLGAFGVLLVTGLVASLFVNTLPAHMPGRDAGAAARFALLATVLLVFSVDRAVWTEQNLFQLFLAAGLAGGTLTAQARAAPAIALPGLSLRREKLLIGAVLSIGCVVAVGNSVRIHFSASRYAPERTVLDLERGVLRDGAEEIPLDGQAIGFIDWFGYIDRGARGGRDAMTVSGWGYDPAATGDALQVLVFRGSELLGVTRTGRARPDLQRTSSLPNLDLLFTGFELRLPRPPGWRPRTEVHAVFLGPSGSASPARVTDAARRRMETLPAGASGFYVYIDETRNALVYVRDECGEDHVGPHFFVHIVPVDGDDLPDVRRKYSFDNIDFHFRDYGFMKDGRCVAERLLPDYDVAEIRTGQAVRRAEGIWEEIWEERFTFDP